MRQLNSGLTGVRTFKSLSLISEENDFIENVSEGHCFSMDSVNSEIKALYEKISTFQNRHCRCFQTFDKR